MKRNLYALIVTFLFVIMLSVGASSSFTQTYGYSVTDLGTLPGGLGSDAKSINNAGQVAGAAVAADGGFHAFLYSNGVMTDLGTAGHYSMAYGINDLGQVTGVLENHTFLYSGGLMNDLGTLPGTDDHKFVNDQCADRNQSTGFAINNSGTVVGTSKCQAMVYSDGKMTGLNLNGSYYALGINNLNQIVGMSQYIKAGAQVNHAFLYSDGHMQDLGAFDGRDFSYATGINDNGAVVGGSQTASGNMRAFLYANGVMTNLGTLDGQVSSIAEAINNQGVIVGDTDTVPFIYRNGVMTDLTTLVPPGILQLYHAADINDAGQIVGYGYNYYGQQHAFLLTPMN